MTDCSDAVCGITDSFDRVVAAGAGTSDAGFAWDAYDIVTAVDGDRAVLSVDTNSSINAFGLTPFTDSTTVMQMGVAGGGGTAALYVQAEGYNPFSYNPFADVFFQRNGFIELRAYDGTTDTEVTTSTTLGWGADTKTSIRLVTGPVTTDLYVWQTGGAQPGSPTLSLSSPGDFALYLMTTYYAGGYVGSGSAYTAYIYEVDIAGIDRCSEYRFDNFNRTVGSGWGTSDFGSTYSYWGMDAEPAFSVAGGSGLVTWGSSQDPTSPEVYFGPSRDTAVDPGPWTEPTWTLAFRMKTGTWGAETQTIRVRTNTRGIWLFMGNVQLLETDEGSAPFAWQQNTWYIVKWYYDLATGDSFLKAWVDGTAEPAWLVTTSTYGGAGGDDPTEWMQFLFRDATNATVQFDYIDFDYDGKPCYLGWVPPEPPSEPPPETPPDLLLYAYGVVGTAWAS